MLPSGFCSTSWSSSGTCTKLLAWSCREAPSLNFTWNDGQQLQARDTGPPGPTGAAQRIFPTVNFLVVYPSHSEGNRALWFLPLPFQRPFVSQITPAMRKHFLAVLPHFQTCFILTHSLGVPWGWGCQGIKSQRGQNAAGSFEVSK